METNSVFEFEYEGKNYYAHLTHLKDDSGTPHVEIDHIEDEYGTHIESDDYEYITVKEQYPSPVWVWFYHIYPQGD
jgi:phosphopantetheine adenylyltransferase